ncbi:hypothetical protein CgunFtcFv8_015550 [Champsocephalus gunnari]|uniref:Uncharacterized protein n=1 Tax=Champsocephalus gunnari TaxID=52237 RepID=A0AAN8C6K8_CHAGU|nr:hypothetical protein CgunFtcFv8_015550 [Champsocephalus gunnari]
MDGWLHQHVILWLKGNHISRRRSVWLERLPFIYPDKETAVCSPQLITEWITWMSYLHQIRPQELIMLKLKRLRMTMVQIRLTTQAFVTKAGSGSFEGSTSPLSSG